MPYTPPLTAKPYTLSVPESDLNQWRQLLELSPLGPKTYENSQSKTYMGMTYEWLAAAKQHWLTKFDWRAQEARINSFPNYTMTIEGIPVHFIGLFSQKPDAVPVIFMHGWPGSFIEFLPMLEHVKAKWSPDEMPFHMVVPSLPGYTLSQALPVDKDWSMVDSARVLDSLMGELGFAKYVAQGGDVGSFLAIEMGLSHDRCVAIQCESLYLLFSTETWIFVMRRIESSRRRC
jgi:microsomal epoxide hydrolase